MKLPMRPLTPIDVINRCAAASGSLAHAAATEDANYNGHPISVSFKPDAMSGATWNAEYWWAGRQVLARGPLRRCLLAARAEYDRGARGASVTFRPHEAAPEPVDEQVALAGELGFVADEEAEAIEMRDRERIGREED